MTQAGGEDHSGLLKMWLVESANEQVSGAWCPAPDSVKVFSLYLLKRPVVFPLISILIYFLIYIFYIYIYIFILCGGGLVTKLCQILATSYGEYYYICFIFINYT